MLRCGLAFPGTILKLGELWIVGLASKGGVHGLGFLAISRGPS